MQVYLLNHINKYKNVLDELIQKISNPSNIENIKYDDIDDNADNDQWYEFDMNQCSTNESSYFKKMYKWGEYEYHGRYYHDGEEDDNCKLYGDFDDWEDYWDSVYN